MICLYSSLKSKSMQYVEKTHFYIRHFYISVKNKLNFISPSFCSQDIHLFYIFLYKIYDPYEYIILHICCAKRRATSKSSAYKAREVHRVRTGYLADMQLSWSASVKARWNIGHFHYWPLSRLFLAFTRIQCEQTNGRKATNEPPGHEYKWSFAL